jgi:hypothetical protein
VERAVHAADGEAWRSIDLGTHAVIAGTEAGLARAARDLPPVTLAGRSFPLRLRRHTPDHTPLAAAVAAAMAVPIENLAFRPPRTTLIDGRGARHTPWSADPSELAAYTAGPYLVSTYSFATSIRVAVREHAPDRILLPGPGTTLAGIVGGIVAGEGYRGVRDRSAVVALQAGDRPLLVGVGR